MTFYRTLALTLGVMMLAGAAHAGQIDRACMAANRSAASPSLCSCIQKAADATLRSSDQSTVAKFFRDPNKAEAMRVSSSRSADAFWERYKAFSARAEASCQG
jgi:hypothetical protein